MGCVQRVSGVTLLAIAPALLSDIEETTLRLAGPGAVSLSRD
jgi:hypothetical protein